MIDSLPKLVFITGKGGVGKTTVTRHLGLESQKKGVRTAVIELNHENQLSRAFGLTKATFGPTSLDKNLDLFSLNPIQCLHNFGSIKLGSKRLVKMLLGHRVIDTLVDSVPGLHDLFQLGKIHHLLTDNGSEEPYDRIFVDTPSTGHALTLFSSAKSIQEMMRVGLVYEEAKAIAETIANPKICASVTVTLPEPLPAQETIHFLQESVIGHPAHAGILFNRWLPSTRLSNMQIESLSDVIVSENNTELIAVFDAWQQRLLVQEDISRQFKRAFGGSIPLFTLQSHSSDPHTPRLIEVLQ